MTELRYRKAKKGHQIFAGKGKQFSLPGKNPGTATVSMLKKRQHILIGCYLIRFDNDQSQLTFCNFQANVNC